MRSQALSKVGIASMVALVCAFSACVQILGDDFEVTGEGGADPTSVGGATSTAGGGGTTSDGGSTGGTQGPGGTGGTGGVGGAGPACGGPGQPCCTMGAPCNKLSCLNDNSCPEIALLVQVPQPAPLTGSYGIDETEVTRTQYEQWLATSPMNTGALLGPGCAGNTEFFPLATCMSNTFVCQGANCGQHPQVCVDWCDAFAYCAAVGKKLCDHVDPGLNSNAIDGNNAFVNACTSGETYTHSPGNGAGDCRTGDFGLTHEVKSVATCQSPDPDFAGVYDLTGNVDEWVDVCSLPSDPNADCNAIGGHFDDDPPFELCIYPQDYPRLDHRTVVGFRCCEL